jgi:hypothetical protein
LLAHELTHVVQQTGHVALQRAPKDPDEGFIIDPRAMDLVESTLRRLYEALPRDERIELKANGTVAIGMVTERGKPNEPRMVYMTNSNTASRAFREAASRVGLTPWVGEAGVAMEHQGLPRSYPATGLVPPGTGGIEHAEQLMLGYADDHGYIVHGMAVSRRLCHDCPIVIRGHKRGRIMVSVIADPDNTLPNPRKERAQAEPRGEATEPPATEGGQGSKREPTGGGPRYRKPPTTPSLSGRGTARDATRTLTALRGGKAPSVPTQRRGGGDVPSTSPTPAPAASSPRVTEGRGEPVAPITVPEPVANVRATRGAVEGAGVMLVAMQLNALRSAELQAAVNKLTELTPTIQRYREQGYGVTLTLVVEVPD